MTTALPYDSLTALLQAPLPIPPELRRQWLKAWIDEEHGRLRDPGFAAAFRHVFEHFDAPPEAYLHRRLESPEGQALAGIRFFNRNPKRPFVELLAWDGPKPELWLPLIATEWSGFRPFAVRVLLAEPTQLAGAELDMSLHGARCSEMAKRDTSDAVTLKAVTDPTAALGLINAVHTDVHERQPALGRQITALDAEGLSWCLEHGKALFITVDDEIAGLIACAPDHIGFLKGQVIFEEVVSPGYQGRRLASAAQAALAEQLSDEDPDALLLGTIAHNNPASRRSAERAGRPAWLSYHFLPL